MFVGDDRAGTLEYKKWVRKWVKYRWMGGDPSRRRLTSKFESISCSANMSQSLRFGATAGTGELSSDFVGGVAEALAAISSSSTGLLDELIMESGFE